MILACYLSLTTSFSRRYAGRQLWSRITELHTISTLLHVSLEYIIGMNCVSESMKHHILSSAEMWYSWKSVSCTYVV
jgi:hypothetical protein